MANSLTTEQVLLLNNLMYMGNNPPLQSLEGNEGKTLAEVINNIDVNMISNSQEYSTFTSGEEWKDIINAVKADEQLMNVQIASTYDDGKGGLNFLFVNPADNEAVVVFRGTGSSYEWGDNFTGGAATSQADGVSTAQQQEALKWYQSLDLDQYETITVSGHSKGGNKSKYITIMDDSVDRCLSFDGQGFSDEFYEVHGDKIADNQYKIHNHNVEGDYVNILLNDVGETTYYKGHNYGDGEFLENHCPNTFLHFREDGTFTIDEGTQDPSVKRMDEFLNSYLRSIPKEDREKTMQIIAEIAQIATGGGDDTVNEILDVILNGKNGAYAADLIAYVVKYEQTYPEFADSINDILNKMGMEDVTKVIDVVTNVMNSKYFDTILNAVDWVGGKIPDWLLDKLSDYLKEKTGIDLSRDQLREILSMVTDVNDQLPNINVNIDGSDMRVESTGSQYKYFSVRLAEMRAAANELRGCSRSLSSMSEEVESIMRGLTGAEYVTRLPLRVCVNRMRREFSSCNSMQSCLENAAKLYEKTEMSIVGNNS